MDIGNFFFKFIYYLFLAVLGLRFCARAFSSCGKRGPLFHCVAWASHYRGLSCCGARAPDAQAEQLWLTGLVAPRHVGSSQTRAQTRVPCIGRQILNHCATREALDIGNIIYTYILLFPVFSFKSYLNYDTTRKRGGKNPQYCEDICSKHNKTGVP